MKKQSNRPARKTKVRQQRCAGNRWVKRAEWSLTVVGVMEIKVKVEAI